MIARVDGEIIAPDLLWWPAMNFDQFRWDQPAGDFELEIPRAEFVRRLESQYQRCVAELRADDALKMNEPPMPLNLAGYPPLALLPDQSTAFTEAVRVYLWEDILTAFLPHPPSSAARFMINSIDRAATSSHTVVLIGRGYHAPPGFAVGV